MAGGKPRPDDTRWVCADCTTWMSLPSHIEPVEPPVHSCGAARYAGKRTRNLVREEDLDG